MDFRIEHWDKNTLDQLPSEWLEVVGDRQLLEVLFVDHALGEGATALLEFRNPKFESAVYYEVGHGEALRPYTKYYSGGDLTLALIAFVLNVARHHT